MSIESEILRIQHNIANTYAAVSEKGGEVPLQPTSANLAAAVASIPTSRGATTILVNAPIGSIMNWSGTEDTVPEGWHVCNGEDGTFDLRDKFVLGAGPSHLVGETGGSETVTLTVAQMPKHNHALRHAGMYAYTSTGTDRKVFEALRKDVVASVGEEIIFSSGSSQPHPNMPPYYALLFIQKVSTTPTDYVTEAEVTAAIQEAISNIPTSGGGVPVGTITIWSGAVADIPTGWALCDGQNDRPDLRGKFILGAGGTYNVGDSGGSETVTLTTQHMPSHNHVVVSSPGGADVSGEEKHSVARFTNTFGDRNVFTNNSGSSLPHPNMPPYYALCYIIKVIADETDGVTMEQVNTAIDAKLEAYTPLETYSTQETRIGTWIDGKPLYRRIFLVTSPSATNTDTPILSLGQEVKVKKIEGMLTTSAGTKGSVNSYLPGFFVACYVYESVYSIYMTVEGEIQTNRPVELCLTYTKTTD